jgi:hypothetical protein
MERIATGLLDLSRPPRGAQVLAFQGLTETVVLLLRMRIITMSTLGQTGMSIKRIPAATGVNMTMVAGRR